MRSVCSLLLPIAMGGACLQAQSASLGVNVGAVFAQGDLSSQMNGKTGPALGLDVTVDLGEGHLLRPRLDYARLKHSYLQGNGGLHFPSTAYSSVEDRMQLVSLMADYNFHFSRRQEGLYLIAGLGYQRLILDGTNRSTENWDGVAIAAGLGWQFNRLAGAEVRYVQCSAKATTYGGASSMNASSLRGGLTFHF